MGPIKPGDRFLLVRPRGRSGSRFEVRFDWVIVTHVGRRWAEFRYEDSDRSSLRFDIETMRVSGGRFSDAGKVYRTRAEYDREARCKRLWKELRDRVDRTYHPPEGITDIAILKAADALGFRLKEE